MKSSQCHSWNFTSLLKVLTLPTEFHAKLFANICTSYELYSALLMKFRYSRQDLSSSDCKMSVNITYIIRLYGSERYQWLTVATILRMAAEAMSSPLGWPTRVIPRYFTLNTIPSSRVSLVSVQFSGSSGWTKRQDVRKHHNALMWLNMGIRRIYFWHVLHWIIVQEKKQLSCPTKAESSYDRLVFSRLLLQLHI